MKRIVLFALIGIVIKGYANPDSISRRSALQPIGKVSARVDFTFMNVTGRTGFRGVGMNGSGQVDYRILDGLSLGVYGGHATDISTKDRYFQIEDKVYNLTTSNLTFFGVAAGYTVWRDGRFNITPDLKLGLGYFRVSEIFNSLNNYFILKRSLVMITPRINFGVLIGRRLETGLNFSYLIPHSVNGDISQYDLGNVSAGIFCKTYF